MGKGEHGRFYSDTGSGEHENGDDIFIHNIVLPHMVCPTNFEIINEVLCYVIIK